MSWRSVGVRLLFWGGMGVSFRSGLLRHFSFGRPFAASGDSRVPDLVAPEDALQRERVELHTLARTDRRVEEAFELRHGRAALARSGAYCRRADEPGVWTNERAL